MDGQENLKKLCKSSDVWITTILTQKARAFEYITKNLPGVCASQFSLVTKVEF